MATIFGDVQYSQVMGHSTKFMWVCLKMLGIFPMIASHFSKRDNDQQDHWVIGVLTTFSDKSILTISINHILTIINHILTIYSHIWDIYQPLIFTKVKTTPISELLLCLSLPLRHSVPHRESADIARGPDVMAWRYPGLTHSRHSPYEVGWNIDK